MPGILLNPSCCCGPGGCSASICVKLYGGPWCGVCLDGPFSVTFDKAVGGQTTWTMSGGAPHPQTVEIYEPGLGMYPYFRMYLYPEGYPLLPNVLCLGGRSGPASGDLLGTVAALALTTDVTCDPLGGSLSVPSSTIGSGVSTIFSDLYAFGVRTASISGPAAYGAGCYPVFSVAGCNGLAVAGATVNIWNSSSKTTFYGSGTTSTSGSVAVPVTTFSPSFYYEVSRSRLVTVSGTQDGSDPADPISVYMSPASGYHCLFGCADPVPETLHATHSVFGSLTLAYDAGGSHGEGWYATTSYTYPGCYCCPAKTVTVTSYLDTAGNFSDYWKSD